MEKYGPYSVLCLKIKMEKKEESSSLGQLGVSLLLTAADAWQMAGCVLWSSSYFHSPVKFQQRHDCIIPSTNRQKRACFSS